jgi:hypothetical protein
MHLDENRPGAGGVLVRVLGLSHQTVASEVPESAAVSARRAELAAGREALQAQAVESARTRADRLQSLSEHAAEIRRTLRDIEAEASTLEAEGWQESVALDSERTLLEAELRRLADPQIAVFMGELLAEADAIMREGAFTVSVRNRLTDEVQTRTNYASVVARLNAIRQAIRDAHDLQLSALSSEDVAERLRTLRAGLPAIATSIPHGTGWEPLEEWTALGAMVAGRPAVVRERRREAPQPPKGGLWKPRGRTA